jgi:transcriptional regulator with XRE-family HTH domain
MTAPASLVSSSQAMTPASKFGSLLRSVRKSRRLKIWQVADKVSVEVKHLGRIERGEKKPSFDLIVALAECLNVSPSRFFEFKNESETAATPTERFQRLIRGHTPEEQDQAVRVIKALFES